MRLLTDVVFETELIFYPRKLFFGFCGTKKLESFARRNSVFILKTTHPLQERLSRSCSPSAGRSTGGLEPLLSNSFYRDIFIFLKKKTGKTRGNGENITLIRKFR